MKRETLVENVKTVIKRAKSKPLPLNVSEVGLFGSLLFGKKNPGDADLYIENMHECPNCGRKVPDWEWDEGEGICDTCVAEDTHAAMWV